MRRRFMRLRGRLWLKVWVALLLTLIASMVFTWAGGRVLSSFTEPQADRVPAVAAVIADSLPNSGDLSRALQERADGLGLRLALYGADGALLATTDARLPSPSTLSPGSWSRVAGGPPVGAARLDDGRVMIGGPVHRWGGGSSLHLLLPLSLLGFLALLSMPLARRVTGRLERLQAGVETLAAGDLSTRVEVEGSDEVARLAAAFNLAAERIEDLMSRQRRMLASASHELRSPLARLRVAVELLADDESELSAERRQELLGRTQSDVGELDGLIEDLLLVGRLGASDPGSQRADPLDLYPLAAEEASRFGAVVDGAPSPLVGDERALRRLLRNLLENAEKHGGGTEIEVSVTPERGGVVLVVADRGPGVSEAERDRIFVPFHRAADHHEGAHGGVGLGLALVREIARAHGGDARCLPRSGGGTEFRVEFGVGPAVS